MKDHPVIGFLAGLLLLGLVYSALSFGLSGWQEEVRYFQAPRIHLFALAISLLVARWVLVRRGLVRTGKAMLLAMLATAFIYIFYSIRFRHGY